MDVNANEMTHDEIWDDSALVRSWNEALAEYKKYHSIHAKGGFTDGGHGPAKGTGPDAKTQTGEGGGEGGSLKAAEAALGAATTENVDETITGVEDTDAQVDENAAATDPETKAVGDDGRGGDGPRGLTPLAVLASVQDEGLKKLMMSWYYAGYYTGLYEGQQQGQQHHHQRQE